MKQHALFDFGQEIEKESFPKLVPQIHNSVDIECEHFYNEENRRLYITPKTYLDALSQFKQLYN